MCMYVYMYICMYIYIYKLYTHMCIMYICMRVCIYIYIYMYIHICALFKQQELHTNNHAMFSKKVGCSTSSSPSGCSGSATGCPGLGYR